MPPSWFGKNDPSEPGSSTGPPPLDGAKPTGDFEQLAEQLGQIESLFGRANQEIAAYLVRRESQAPSVELSPASVSDDKLAALADKLDQLDSRLKTLSEATSRPGPTDAAPAPSSPEILAAINQQNTIIRDQLGQLQTQLENGFDKLTNLIVPKEKPAPAGKSLPTGTAAWEQAILGASLAGNADLAFKRQELLEGILEGNSGARSLAGQLLVFQSASAERLPKLLKEIGEAYYAWQPKRIPGTNPLEEALVAWLQRICETAGISNTIELVHPGERFDATRHNASSRGVEISEVHGWIVLRDNGKVYTKANVAVK